MADPLRLRVLKALTETIKTITPTNGCLHDLSDYASDGRVMERVFRGRDLFGFDDPLPMVSILEKPVPLEQLRAAPDNTTRFGEWEIIIQGFVEDDLNHPTDPAHFLAAEVSLALALEKRKRHNILGIPRVNDLRLGAPVVRPADGEISAVAFFLLPLTITLAEDLLNPFPPE